MGLLVAPPATKLRSVTKTVALHVVVRDLHHELGTNRLPRQILAAAPPTLRAGHPMRHAVTVLYARPVTPRVILERVLPIRLEKLHQLSPLLIGEARADADVLEVSLIVVQPE